MSVWDWMPSGYLISSCGCSKHHEEGHLLPLTEYPYLIFSLSVPQGPGLGECLVMQRASICTRDSLGDSPVQAEKCFWGLKGGTAQGAKHSTKHPKVQGHGLLRNHSSWELTQSGNGNSKSNWVWVSWEDAETETERGAGQPEPPWKKWGAPGIGILGAHPWEVTEAVDQRREVRQVRSLGSQMILSPYRTQHRHGNSISESHIGDAGVSGTRLYMCVQETG